MGLKIPAKESFVRILSKHSGKVLSDNDGLDHEDKDKVNTNQWWHIQPQTDGRYIIVNDVSKRVLWCRNKDRRAGCIDDHGKWSDNWFVFEEGKLQYDGWFRIKCPATNCVIVSRTDKEPQLDGFHLNSDGGPVYEDHYFQFLDEDVGEVEIEYHLPDPPQRGQPNAINQQTLANGGDLQQSQTFTWTTSKSNEHSWEFSESIEVGYSTEFEANIPTPINIGTKVTWDFKSTTTFKYGQKKTDTDTWALTQPVNVPAHAVVDATTVCHQSKLNVPFTMTWKTKYSQTRQKMEGVYKGVQYWGFETKFEQSKLNEDRVDSTYNGFSTFWDLPGKTQKPDQKPENRSLDGDQETEFTEVNENTEWNDRDMEQSPETEFTEPDQPAESEGQYAGQPDVSETAGPEYEELNQPERDEAEYQERNEAELDQTAEQEYQEPEQPELIETEEAQDQFEEAAEPGYQEPDTAEQEYQELEQADFDQPAEQEYQELDTAEPSYEEPNYVEPNETGGVQTQYEEAAEPGYQEQDTAKLEQFVGYEEQELEETAKGYEYQEWGQGESYGRYQEVEETAKGYEYQERGQGESYSRYQEVEETASYGRY